MAGLSSYSVCNQKCYFIKCAASLKLLIPIKFSLLLQCFHIVANAQLLKIQCIWNKMWRQQSTENRLCTLCIDIHVAVVYMSWRTKKIVRVLCAYLKQRFCFHRFHLNQHHLLWRLWHTPLDDTPFAPTVWHWKSFGKPVLYVLIEYSYQ